MAQKREVRRRDSRNLFIAVLVLVVLILLIFGFNKFTGRTVDSDITVTVGAYNEDTGQVVRRGDDFEVNAGDYIFYEIDPNGGVYDKDGKIVDAMEDMRLEEVYYMATGCITCEQLTTGRIKSTTGWVGKRLCLEVFDLNTYQWYRDPNACWTTN